MILRNQNPVAFSDTLWNSQFLCVNLTLFFMFTNISLLYLYPLALKAMGADRRTIGWVMGIFSIAAVLSRPLMGSLVNRLGESRVIFLGMALGLLSSLTYWFITDFSPLIFFIRVFHGIGFSAVIAAGFALVARSASPPYRGRAFSMVGVSLMAGVGLAPAVGEALISRHGFAGLYAAAVGSVVLGWISAFTGLRSGRGGALSKGQKAGTGHLALLKNKPFICLLSSTFIFAHSQATLTNFLALIAAKHEGPAGPFFFFAYLAAITVLLTLARLLDRYGQRCLACFSYPFFSLGILLVPSVIASPLFVVAAVMFGAGMGLLFATHNALAGSHGSFREKPAVMALFTGIYDSGFITGAVLSGWVAHYLGLDMLFVVSGLFSLLGLMITLFSPMREL